MIDGETVQREARLAAIEHLLMHHFALTTLHLSDDQFSQMGKTWRQSLDRETFEGADAAVSDLLSGEIRDAMMKLLEGVRDNRERMKNL